MKTTLLAMILSVAVSVNLAAQNRGRSSNPGTQQTTQRSTSNNVSSAPVQRSSSNASAPSSAKQNQRAETSSNKNGVRPEQNTHSKPATVNHAHDNGVNRNGMHTDTKNKNLNPHHVAPEKNYTKMPKQGQVITSHKAEKRAQHIKHNGHDFYYKNGVFYKHNGKEYVVHRAYPGMRVRTLPEARRIVIGNVHYWYYYGTFYRICDSTREYEVVVPPVGAIVESIPDGYEKLVIDGNTYYIVNGVQYMAIIYNGEIWYEVIKSVD